MRSKAIAYWVTTGIIASELVAGGITDLVRAPGLPRLKEWAYAGILFELTGAIASSIKRGVGLGNLVAPGLFVVCTLASWALRPPSRTFASRSFSAPTELGPAEISI